MSKNNNFFYITRSEEICRCIGSIAIIGWELVSRAYQSILKWFGHMEKMAAYCMAREVLMVDVSGGQVWGKPRLG